MASSGFIRATECLAELRILLSKITHRQVNIVLHSSLIGFGRISSSESKILAAELLKLSDLGILAVPAHSHLGRSNRIFEYESTFDRSLGAIPSLAFNEFQCLRWKRSFSAIHSYLIGGAAGNIKASDYGAKDYSFGPNSIFQAFKTSEFYWLNFGCSAGSAYTLIHDEESCFSKARSPIVFEVEYRKDGRSTVFDYKYAALKDGDSNVNSRIYCDSFYDTAIYCQPLKNDACISLHEYPLLSKTIREILEVDPRYFISSNA